MTFNLSLSGADLLLLLPEIFLTIWLCIILALDFSLKRITHQQLGHLSIAGLGITALMLLVFDQNSITGALFKNMYVLDHLAIFFKIIIVGATALVLFLSIDYVREFRFFKGEYYFMVLMSALGMMFMASANDLLSVFVTLEFSTFGFYVLVAYLRDDQRSSEAGLKFFILGVFAAGLLAYGISFVYGETGTLVFSEMAGTPGSYGLAIGFILIFAALGFKIGAVPFHAWIPDTYQGAPTPVTAFLSIAPKVAALAILLRMFFVALGFIQAHVGVALCHGLDLFDDLRQHRGHRPKKHQTTVGLFGDRANWKYHDWISGGNQARQRRHHVLPTDLYVREFRSFRSGHCRQSGDKE